MAIPLILTEEEYIARQAEFAEYDKAFAQQCVNEVLYAPLGATNTRAATVDAKALTARVRKTILDELALMSQKGEMQLPQIPIWGPTVQADSAITVYFKLVAQGTEDQHESTDGMGRQPPPIPLKAIHHVETEMHIEQARELLANQRFTIEYPTSKGIPVEEQIRQLEREGRAIAPECPQKLYKVTEAIELSPEQIHVEMGQKKRKGSKPAVYIRGNIVEPKVRLEF